MVDWVCGSLIPRLHLTTLLRRLRLQINLYNADSGSKSFTLDLLRRDTHWAGTGKSGSVGISFPQLEFPKRNPGSSRERDAASRCHTSGIQCWLHSSCRHWIHRTCFYTSWSLHHLAWCRLGLQTNLYYADSGSKSFTQDGSSHTEMHSLHSFIVEGSGDPSSIFFYSLWKARTYSHHSNAHLTRNRACHNLWRMQGESQLAFDYPAVNPVVWSGNIWICNEHIRQRGLCCLQSPLLGMEMKIAP